MKRLLSSLLLVILLACAQQRAGAQDDMQSAPPPPDNGQGPGPDQGPPPDQGAPPDQGGDPGVSYQTFYDNLSNQGTWVQTDDYGYVFQPTVSDPNWAPYTDGHWVYTDQGWMWVSDEPWGWATYHYGRWCNIDGTGWCWVPGYRWAPAWVSWRYGGGYCGWAPLPPQTFIGVEFGGGGGGFGGFYFGSDVDVSFGIGAGCYNFIPVGRFGDDNYRGAFVNRYNNYGIINRTTNITNITVNRNGTTAFNGVRAGGPPVDEISAQSGHRFETMHLAAAGAPGHAGIQGNAVSVYAPRVNSTTANQARPAAVARTITHPTFNRGDSITRPLAVNSSLRPPPPTASMIQKAKLAQAHAPASAKIATTHTPIRSSRLNGLRPVTQSHTATSGGFNNVNKSATVPAEGTEIRHTETTPAYHPEAENNEVVHHTEPMKTYQPEKPKTTEVRHTEEHHTESEGERSTSNYHPQIEHSQAEKPHTEMHEAGPQGKPAAKGDGKDKKNQG